MGIEDLKDVVKAGLSLGQALSDGIQISDLGALMDVPDAIVGISNVPAEIADLDEAEKEELQQFVKANFDIADDNMEEIIEEAVVLAISLYKLGLLFKGSRTA